MYQRGDQYRQIDRRGNQQNERHRESERRRGYDDYVRHDNEVSRTGNSRTREDIELDCHRKKHDWDDDTSRRDRQDQNYRVERRRVDDENGHRRKRGSTGHDMVPVNERFEWDTLRIDETEIERNEPCFRRLSPQRHDNRRDRTFRNNQQDQRYREDNIDRGYQERGGRNERKYTELEYDRNPRSENDHPSRGNFDGDPDNHYVVEQRHSSRDRRCDESEFGHRRRDKNDDGLGPLDMRHEFERAEMSSRGRMDETGSERDDLSRIDRRIQRNSPIRRGNSHNRTLQDDRVHRHRRERSDRRSRDRHDIDYIERENQRDFRSEDDHPSQSRSRRIYDNDPDDNYLTGSHSSRDRRYDLASSSNMSAASEHYGHEYKDLDRDNIEDEVHHRRRHDINTGFIHSDGRREYERQELSTHGGIDETELLIEDHVEINPHALRNSPIRRGNSHNHTLQHDRDHSYRQERSDSGSRNRRGIENAEHANRDFRSEDDHPSQSRSRRIYGTDPDDLHSSRGRRYNQSSSPLPSEASERYGHSYKDLGINNMEDKVDHRRRDNIDGGFIHPDERHELERRELGSHGRMDETEPQRDNLARTDPHGQRIIPDRHDRTLQNDQDHGFMEDHRGHGGGMNRHERECADQEYMNDLRSETDLNLSENNRYKQSSNLVASSTERFVDDNRDFDRLSLENEKVHGRQDRVRVDLILKRKAELGRDNLDRICSPGRRRLDEDVIRGRLLTQDANDGKQMLRTQRLVAEDFSDRGNLPQNERDEMLIDRVLETSGEENELNLLERQVVIALLRERAAKQRLHSETTLERSQKGLQERIRDRSPIDSRSQKGQVIERSRNILRVKRESQLRQMAPMRQLPSLQLTSQPNVNLGEIHFMNQDGFDQENDPVYEQVSDEEAELTDRAVDPLLLQDPHLARDQVFQKIFSDETLELNLNKEQTPLNEQTFSGDVDQIFPVDDAEVLQEPYVMDLDNLGGIRQTQNVGFPQSDLLNKLHPNVSEPYVLPIGAALPEAVGEPTQMQPLGNLPKASVVRGMEQISTNVNILPICMPDFEGIPLISNVVPIPQITNLTQPNIGNQSRPNLHGNFPQQSNLGGNLPRPGLEVNFSVTNTDGMPLRPAMDGMPLRPAMDGMPLRPAMDGMPLRPAMDGMPPRFGINGMPIGPHFHGMPPRPFFRGMPPRPFFRGMPPRPGMGGMPPRPGVHGMPPRPGVHGMPPRPFFGRMPFRPANGGMPPMLSGKSTNPNNTVGKSKQEIPQVNTKTDGIAQKTKNTEISETSNNDKNIIEFQTSMRCPVCPDSKIFQKESEFDFHWKMFHVKVRENLLCPADGCTSSTSTFCKLWDHFRRVHNEGSDELSTSNKHKMFIAKKERVDNPLYKDPGEKVYGHNKQKTYVKFSKGIRCPVCTNYTSFKFVDAFKEHWQNFHVKYHKMYLCTSAGCNNVWIPTIKRLKRHYWKKHNYGNDELTLAAMESLDEAQSKIMKNESYKDPGQFEYDGCNPLAVEFEPGMTCPICPEEKIPSLFQYHHHWQNFHVEYDEFLLCPMAGCESYGRKPILQSHLYKDHDFTEADAFAMIASAKKDLKENKCYIDPKNCIFSSV